MSFTSSPAFETWLLTERRRLGAAAEGVLREAALERLGAGDAVTAAALAGRLVRLNPLDENFQALLVRSLATSGDGVGAARQVVRRTELFRITTTATDVVRTGLVVKAGLSTALLTHELAEIDGFTRYPHDTGYEVLDGIDPPAATTGFAKAPCS